MKCLCVKIVSMLIIFIWKDVKIGRKTEKNSIAHYVRLWSRLAVPRVLGIIIEKDAKNITKEKMSALVLLWS